MRDHSKTVLCELALSHQCHLATFVDRRNWQACVFEDATQQGPTKYAIVLERGSQTLQALMNRHQDPLTLLNKIDIMSQVLESVKYMHDARWVHSDLKPTNIMEFGSWKVKLIDFDCCCMIGEELRGITPEVCPPEVAHQIVQKRQPILASPAIDCWSLGVLFFEMLTGQSFADALFPGSPAMDKQQLFSAIAEVKQLHIDSSLDSVSNSTNNVLIKNSASLVKKLLQVDPLARWGAAAALQHALFKGVASRTHDVRRRDHEEVMMGLGGIQAGVRGVEAAVQRLEQRTHATLNMLTSRLTGLSNLVEMGHRLTANLVDRDCPRTFIILPVQLQDEPAVGSVQQRAASWLRGVKDCLTAPPSAQGVLQALVNEFALQEFRLYLVCELTGQRQGEGYRVTQPKELIRQCLPYMQVGFKLMSACNGVASIARAAFPCVVPKAKIPESFMAEAREVLCALDQKSSVAPYSGVQSALEAELGLSTEQLGSAARAFREFLRSADPTHEWGGLQRYVDGERVLWASAEAVAEAEVEAREQRAAAAEPAHTPPTASPPPLSSSAAEAAAPNGGARGAGGGLAEGIRGGTAGPPEAAAPSPGGGGSWPRTDLSIRPCSSENEENFFFACQMNNVLLMEKLLADRSVNPNATYHSKTPLFYAKHREVVIALLRAGVDVNAKDGNGKTPLFGAINGEVVTALLGAGADVNARDNNGETPLFKAISGEVAKALLCGGADVNARDKDGKTPLFYAKDGDVVTALLGAGADVNARDKNGATPLFRAWRREIVTALLEAGADARCKDWEGKTAMKENKSEEAKKVIKAHIRKHDGLFASLFP